MKTIKTLVMIFAAALISNVAAAIGNLKVSVLPAASETALIEISNAKMAKFEIDIRDERGDIIFAKKTKELATDYRKLYDFSVLEDGDYTLTVNIDNESVENHIRISNGKVELLKEKKNVSPYFHYKNDALYMSFLNFSGDDMKLYVYDDRNLLFEKEIDPSFTVHEGLDFSKVDRGSYRIVFENGMKMYQYDFAKD